MPNPDKEAKRYYNRITYICALRLFGGDVCYGKDEAFIRNVLEAARDNYTLSELAVVLREWIEDSLEVDGAFEDDLLISMLSYVDWLGLAKEARERANGY